MSHFRRNYGRFTSSSANEHYQRQLTAPVNKWKKQWVTPIGLAPESSYKICKWVKQKEKAKLTGAIEVDDNTPVPDEGDEEEGDDQGEGEDQEMEEDDQEQEGDDDEGEPEGEEEEEAKGTTTVAPTPAPAPISDPATSQANAGDIPKAEGIVEATISKEEVITETEKPSTEAEPTPIAAEEKEGNHESTIPTHNPIPSNAIELHPIAPSSTETGLGEIATTEPVLELETRPAEDAAIPEEKMDVEETTEEGGAAVEEDKGLVHGEMDAPTQALEVEGAEVPREVEKE
ncbi:hypothetical protein I302_104266 [Kwoniella bestiolae CBS 10118]|uniref:Uncharacterized protein n=1 Tax=Kwoniella bestiolae CBS 10118 TaxID=1296100 RepID=A0A1B9GAS1_9TREE|nr:hypothetical protein I302_02974 [Kwoniella bestiolae CBS 10118]OCF28123.1 hypothetical protein I302_02974 [Kwoniella bestiolae CBS 10118]